MSAQRDDRTFGEVSGLMVRWLRLNPDAPSDAPELDWFTKSQQPHTIKRWSITGLRVAIESAVARHLAGELDAARLAHATFQALVMAHTFGFRYGQNYERGLPLNDPFPTDDDGEPDREWRRFIHNFMSGFDAGFAAASGDKEPQ